MNKLNNDITIVDTVLKFNRLAYIEAIALCKATNIKSPKKIIESIKEVFKPCTSVIISAFKQLITITGYAYEQVSILHITEQTELDCDTIRVLIEKAIDISKRVHKHFFELKKKLTEHNCDRIKFAWCKKLGLAILDEIEVKIGGQKIDKHYGNWLNIWYELTANRDLQHLYNELIGNIHELTEFNREVKPEYTVQIPLQFWFCRFSGSALPLCCLENQDVTFHIKTKKLQEICKVEPDVKILSKDNEGVTIEELADSNFDLKARMLIDYIYLEKDERRRFAISSNEYLIEQLQREQFFEVNGKKTTLSFEAFVNPTKEFIFVAQDEDRLRQGCQWFNYGLTDEGLGNPVSKASIIFETYVRVIELDGAYYNYVQPWEKHNTTPSDGINIYSFALYPEEYQPTGSANLSKIRRLGLELQFVHPRNYTVTGYTTSMNILRFIGGMAGLAFNWG
jgi:hypothetical protein